MKERLNARRQERMELKKLIDFVKNKNMTVVFPKSNTIRNRNPIRQTFYGRNHIYSMQNTYFAIKSAKHLVKKISKHVKEK